MVVPINQLRRMATGVYGAESTSDPKHVLIPIDEEDEDMSGEKSEQICTDSSFQTEEEVTPPYLLQN